VDNGEGYAGSVSVSGTSVSGASGVSGVAFVLRKKNIERLEFCPCLSVSSGSLRNRGRYSFLNLL
jgi:hypothetical protein